jgi:hypothetical protein
MIEVTAVCDGCGRREHLKCPPAQAEREIEGMGWWVRDDGSRDLCPNHPHPVPAGVSREATP